MGLAWQSGFSRRDRSRSLTLLETRWPTAPLGLLEMQMEGVPWQALELRQTDLGHAPEALDAVDMDRAPDELVPGVIDAQVTRFQHRNRWRCGPVPPVAGQIKRGVQDTFRPVPHAGMEDVQNVADAVYLAMTEAFADAFFGIERMIWGPC